jgi:Protein of unknown function (DUF3592)
MVNFFPVLFGFGAFILLSLSIYFLISNLIKLNRWEKAIGKVTKFSKEVTGQGIVLISTEELEASIGGEVVFYPVIEFKDATGKVFTFTSKIGSSDPSSRKSFNPQKELQILYDPKNPTKASIYSSGLFWVPSIVLGILGVLFLAAVVSMLS